MQSLDKTSRHNRIVLGSYVSDAAAALNRARRFADEHKIKLSDEDEKLIIDSVDKLHDLVLKIVPT